MKVIVYVMFITYTAVLVVMLMLAFLNDPTNSVSGRIYHTVLLRTDGALPLLLALLSDKYTSLRIMVRKHGVLPTVYNMAGCQGTGCPMCMMTDAFDAGVLSPELAGASALGVSGKDNRISRSHCTRS